jgi:hypothetical protein
MPFDTDCRLKTRKCTQPVSVGLRDIMSDFYFLDLMRMFREDTGVSDERDTDEMVMVFEWICSTAPAAPFPFRTSARHGPPRSDQF